MKYYWRFSLALVSAAFVLSCDGGAITNGSEAAVIPADARAQHLGYVSIQRDNSQGETTTKARASFIKTRVAQPVWPSIEQFDDQNDTCEVLPLESSLSRGSQASAPPIQTTPISAGDRVVINDGTSQYATLIPDAQLNYNTPYDFKEELPVNMTAHTTGDEFPQVSAPFPTVKPLQVTRPTSITAARIDLPLLWDSNNSTYSQLEIAFTGDNSNEALVVYCYASDDGIFELPEETRLALGSDFEITFLLMIRRSAQFTYTDNTLLITTVSPAPYYIGNGNFALGL